MTTREFENQLELLQGTLDLLILQTLAFGRAHGHAIARSIERRSEEARRAAMRKFGNVPLAQEKSREVWGWLWLEQLWQDLRYALRGVRKNSGFTSVALLSLMLGIGASIALFSVVYGVLIAPYPYAKPNQIWAPAVLGPNDPVHGWHWDSQREMGEGEKLPAFGEVRATSRRPG